MRRWMDGIADTGNIVAYGSAVAVADRAGNLCGHSRFTQGLP
jgi:hypothetical protein